MAKRAQQAERVAYTIRLPRRLVDELTKEAGGLGLSRNQLTERLLRHGLMGFKAGRQADDAGLFDELHQEIESVIEDALRKAVRQGGPDAALWRANQAKKAARKQAKKQAGKGRQR